MAIHSYRGNLVISACESYLSPSHPFSIISRPTDLKGILVISPSVVLEWVLVVSARYFGLIWFSVSGSRSRTNVRMII